MTFYLKHAEPEDFPALHGILCLCGEHMHRTQGYDHWYPFRSFESFMSRVDPERLYAVYDDVVLIGTFNLNTSPRPYYLSERWHNPAARALYFGGFGILPSFQSKGAGSWTMQQVEGLACAEDYQAVRFDGAAHNTSLMRFYDRLGYQRCGVITFENGYHPVMCFEKVLESSG